LAGLNYKSSGAVIIYKTSFYILVWLKSGAI